MNTAYSYAPAYQYNGRNLTYNGGYPDSQSGDPDTQTGNYSGYTYGDYTSCNNNGLRLQYRAWDHIFDSESYLKAYEAQGPAHFTAQNTLNAYEVMQQATFHTQSILHAYQLYDAAFTAASSNLVHYIHQIGFANQSQNIVYHSNHGAVGAASTLPVYITYTAEFCTLSRQSVYERQNVAVYSQAAIITYGAQTVNAIAQSVLPIYGVCKSQISSQQKINAYIPVALIFSVQSAVSSYLSRHAIMFAQSTLPVYVVTQGECRQQSSLFAYVVARNEFTSQSGISAYTASLMQGLFTAQSALAATEAYYAWAMNLTTGAISKFDHYRFNSLSGHVGSDESGVYSLYGATDHGAAINGFIESGKLDFTSPTFAGAKRKQILDAYVSAEGGPSILTLTVEKEKPVAYRIPATSTLRNSKITPAKGLSGRYWSVKLANTLGSKIITDAIELNVKLLSSRV